jgi:hypothetical protein
VFLNPATSFTYFLDHVPSRSHENPFLNTEVQNKSCLCLMIGDYSNVAGCSVTTCRKVIREADSVLSSTSNFVASKHGTNGITVRSASGRLWTTQRFRSKLRPY